MLNVVYFASLRERLGLEKEQVEYSPLCATVEGLIDFLVAERDDWQPVFKDGPVMVAVNQEMCDLSQGLVDGDEVAFFPPVTGG